MEAFTPRWAESVPNVALFTGRGVTLLACAPDLAAADRARLLALLGACGAVHELPRSELAYYTALSSCGPGLYAHLLERWADAVSARRGYDRELCRAMVRDTMAGTLALHAEDGIDAAEVVHRVAHPGGSTEQGLKVIDQHFAAIAEEMLRAMNKW
jgi:pyrroline-5-carboxylate reductase